MARVKKTRSKKIDGTQATTAAFERPYRCTHERCDKAFTRAEHLKRHQLNRIYIRLSLGRDSRMLMAY